MLRGGEHVHKRVRISVALPPSPPLQGIETDSAAVFPLCECVLMRARQAQLMQEVMSTAGGCAPRQCWPCAALAD